MKYKVGDRVKIKSRKEIENLIEITNSMLEKCETVMTIEACHPNCASYHMKEDNPKFLWSDEMIEGLVKEEDLNLKFKDGDRVFNTATRKWVNIIEFDLETGLYIVRYDDGLQGRSLESELTFEDDEEE